LVKIKVKKRRKKMEKFSKMQIMIYAENNGIEISNRKKRRSVERQMLEIANERAICKPKGWFSCIKGDFQVFSTIEQPSNCYGCSDYGSSCGFYKKKPLKRREL
jgi:hypothetical protein